MEIVLAKPAVKALQRMPKNEAQRIRGKIEQLATQPEALANNIKKLTGIDAYRLRVGDWRVIYTEDGKILSILNIAARGSAYG